MMEYFGQNKLTGNIKNKETSDLLYQVRLQELEPEKLTGLGFVETPEKYRIAKPLKEDI